ncbi:pentapeptide repeat-containing protein [Pantoea stewartii]|uniref:pentapeptide repeat-containing protein n=1 Tax=Pantoea stewartii TaxID=66269 RepID=UPI0016297415|nr:pentapeptide repeat-containing protein [Pantoea stewartii]MBC0853849.1 pentapeptide repeat-containing protein [Pantoea stewartii]
MNATELQKVLEEHKVWITSMRESGSKADLCGADLRGANLCGADLRAADLCGANLRDANLRDANLCDANLCGANLRDANLRGANLRAADLCGADLRGAFLYGANLRDANLPDHTFVIMGEVYYLQITNGEYIKAGCQNHTAEQWRTFSKREIAEMDGRKALKFYPRLLDVIDFYLGKGERPDWLNEPDSDEE